MNIVQNSNAGLIKPNSAIGFTAILNGSSVTIDKSQQTLHRALAHFDNIKQLSLNIGQTVLTIWGRGSLEDCCHRLPDNSLLILIGSPLGDYTWQYIEEKILAKSDGGSFTLPWDGQIILLKINSTGDKWTMWNDWVGSIPVFHAQTPFGRVTSTLEPVVVDVAGLSSNDIFLPGLLALLIWGHYISDWTLFKSMNVVPLDCEAKWDEKGFRYELIHTIQPTDSRREYSLDDLIDEMYDLTRKAISLGLEKHSRYIIPISGGLDLRLIAGVAADLGVNAYTYTWGTPNTTDVVNGKNIARTINLPWKYINPGNTYLTTYKQLWADLFGSSMHFHGMYQMPFLDALRHEPDGPIVSGFIGGVLGGFAVKDCCEAHSSQYPYQILPDGYLMWTIKDLHQLINGPIDNILAEIAAEVDKQFALIPGAIYQRLRYLILWGRQHHFIYFQTTMCDYWRGVLSPYINRDYANFTFSLPRTVLDNKFLKQLMLRRYYPKLAAIPGTYANEPVLLTGRFLLKKRVAKYLPETASRIIFPDLYKIKLNSEVDCVRKDGKESFSPLFDHLDLLKKWMNPEVIEKCYNQIIENNDFISVKKLQCIQTLAYRMSQDSKQT